MTTQAQINAQLQQIRDVYDIDFEHPHPRHLERLLRALQSGELTPMQVQVVLARVIQYLVLNQQ